jgi:hypothetical protein
MTGDALSKATLQFLSEPGRVHVEKPFRTEAIRQAIEGLFANAAPTDTPANLSYS